MQRRLLIALVSTAVLGFGCGGDSEPEARDGPLLDERAGAFRGVTLGDAPREVERRRGAPQRPPTSREATPTEAADDVRATFGGTQPPTSRATLRVFNYSDATYLSTREDGVYAVLVTADGARTRAGIAIGDPLDEVRRRYRAFQCGVKNASSEYVDVPYCAGRVAPGRHLWFGGDPVKSVTLATEPMVGPDFR